MQPEQANQMLCQYKANKARREHLLVRIADLTNLLSEMEKDMVNDAIHITSDYSGQPRGGSIGDPTGKLGAFFGGGQIPQDIKNMKTLLAKLKQELREKTTAVEYVDAWLQALTDRERYIIEMQMIDQQFWRDVVDGFQARYGIAYSKDRLRDMKQAALDKIHQIAT